MVGFLGIGCLLYYHNINVDTATKYRYNNHMKKKGTEKEKMMQKVSKEVAPGIVVIENAIDNSDHLISLGKSRTDWKSSEVFGQNGFLGVDLDARVASTLNVEPTLQSETEWFVLAKQFWLYGNEYGKKYNAPFSGIEGAQMLRYGVNEGHYKTHTDSGPGAPRIFSAVLYLNDVEEGGETHFPVFDVSVKPEKNKLVLFPSNYMYKHAALPPISNEKFCIVTWYIP